MAGQRMLNSAGKRILDATGKPILAGATPSSCCCGSGSGGGSCMCCSDTMGLSALVSFSGLTYSNCQNIDPCAPPPSLSLPHYYITIPSALGSYCINFNGCSGSLSTPFSIELYGSSPCTGSGVPDPSSSPIAPPAYQSIEIIIGKGCNADGRSGAYWQVEIDANNIDYGDYSLFYGRTSIADCTSSVVVANQLTGPCTSAGTSASAIAWGGSCSITIRNFAC